MKRHTEDEAVRWSVTPDGLSWLDEHGHELQVDSTGRLLVGAVVKHNGSREYWGAGQMVNHTPRARKIMAAAVEGRHLSREQQGRIMAEALEQALRASRLGQMALPVD